MAWAYSYSPGEKHKYDWSNGIIYVAHSSHIFDWQVDYVLLTFITGIKHQLRFAFVTIGKQQQCYSSGLDQTKGKQESISVWQNLLESQTAL